MESLLETDSYSQFLPSNRFIRRKVERHKAEVSSLCRRKSFPVSLIFLRFAVLFGLLHIASAYLPDEERSAAEEEKLPTPSPTSPPECPVILSPNRLVATRPARACRCTSLHEIWCQNLEVIPDFQPTDDDRVFTGLYISRQFIRELPQGAFVNLNVLKIVLNFNPVGDVISASAFAGLGQHLRELHLGQCWIRNLPDGLLSGLDKLTHLHLWSNNIQRIPPAFFKNVPNLRELILWGNNISNVDENTFAGMWFLRRLDLDRNNIASLNKEVFRHLSRLNVLYLGENRLHSLYAETFTHMHSLRVLKIDRNRLVYFNPSAFVGLGELRVLALHDNNISFVPDELLAPMSNLTVVQLSNNRIEFILPKTFSGLRLLSALYLGGNKLTSIPDGAFRQTHKLRQLYLERNQLQGVTKCIIKKTRLRTLSLAGNPITCDCRLAWLVDIHDSGGVVWGTCGGGAEGNGTGRPTPLPIISRQRADGCTRAGTSAPECVI